MSGRTEFPFAAALGGDAKRSSLLLVDVVIRGWATLSTCFSGQPEAVDWPRETRRMNLDYFFSFPYGG